MRNLIAILRGIKPSEVEQVGEVILNAGISMIEVPLNSPDPLDSIERLVKCYASSAIIGAGTVLTTEDVKAVHDVGGSLIVSPNCNIDVIKITKKKGMLSYPGVFTASECFSAVAAGADGLKLFPASVLGIDGLKALRAVLPVDFTIYGVSGISPDEFSHWRQAGMQGFGIGSNLYKAGMEINNIKANAVNLVTAYDACVT